MHEYANNFHICKHHTTSFDHLNNLMHSNINYTQLRRKAFTKHIINSFLFVYITIWQQWFHKCKHMLHKLYACRLFTYVCYCKHAHQKLQWTDWTTDVLTHFLLIWISYTLYMLDQLSASYWAVTITLQLHWRILLIEIKWRKPKGWHWKAASLASVKAW